MTCLGCRYGSPNDEAADDDDIDDDDDETLGWFLPFCVAQCRRPLPGAEIRLDGDAWRLLPWTSNGIVVVAVVFTLAAAVVDVVRVVHVSNVVFVSSCSFSTSSFLPGIGGNGGFPSGSRSPGG